MKVHIRIKKDKKTTCTLRGYTPDEKYVVGVDLGIDKIITYEVKDSTLTEVNRLSVNPGSIQDILLFIRMESMRM